MHTVRGAGVAGMLTSGMSQIAADVAVIGSGFAGSLTALALRRLGRSVALLERGSHPRFAIGESSTPLANLLLEELCDRYGFDGIRALSKWGTWRQRFPGVGGGLKRGFSFFRHDFDAPFTDDATHRRQLLVAASPHDEIGDTHWYRPDVDHLLACEAERAGALHLDRTLLTGCRFDESGAVLEGTRAGESLQVRARFVVDASGPRGFLHRSLGLGERPLRWLPPTEGLYTHFEGVERWDRVTRQADAAPPPYPVDSAAVHHVFPGGWIWVLRFENGITSAGAALTRSVAGAIRVADEGAWDRLLERLPSVAAQFRHARPSRAFVHAPRLAFRSASISGPRWALLPSAAGIIDPLLSTGFPLTLLGIERLLAVLERPAWDGSGFETALAAYAEQTARELDATECLVGALYASMSDFDLFKRLTLLYFAAASFSETARRLGAVERAKGFLLCDDPAFAPELRACAEAALASPRGLDRDALFSRIDRAIEPFDVAGLRDRSRRDWYPVLAGDLLAAAPKLGATPDQLDRLLERSGFAPACGRARAPES
jgi:FADH2 O2-dependent halogenase